MGLIGGREKVRDQSLRERENERRGRKKGREGRGA